MLSLPQILGGGGTKDSDGEWNRSMTNRIYVYIYTYVHTYTYIYIYTYIFRDAYVGYGEDVALHVRIRIYTENTYICMQFSTLPV